MFTCPCAGAALIRSVQLPSMATADGSRHKSILLWWLFKKACTEAEDMCIKHAPRALSTCALAPSAPSSWAWSATIWWHSSLYNSCADLWSCIANAHYNQLEVHRLVCRHTWARYMALAQVLVLLYKHLLKSTAGHPVATFSLVRVSVCAYVSTCFCCFAIKC